VAQFCGKENFMKLKKSSYVLIGIMVIALFFGILSLTYASLKTKLFPAIVCGVAFVLSAVELRKELVSKKDEKEAAEEETDIEITAKGETTKYIRAFGWMVGLLVGIFLVGFLISIPVFMFFFMMTHHRGWLKSAGLAAFFIVVVYVMFIVVLQVDLYHGVLFELF
jgi:hypothetical protein